MNRINTIMYHTLAANVLYVLTVSYSFIKTAHLRLSILITKEDKSVLRHRKCYNFWREGVVVVKL